MFYTRITNKSILTLLIYLMLTPFYLHANNPKMVYTAFDGDNIMYVDYMRDRILKLNKVPLNPGHVLGYYVSTQTSGGRKFDVMRDCLTLVKIIDEFCIFIKDEKTLKINNLSEGMLTEMLYHLKNHNGKAEFHWDSIENCLKIDQNNQLNTITLTLGEFKKILGSKFYSIQTALNSLIAEQLPPVVHVVMSDKNIKYADWVRVKAYKNNKVALIPQLIIPEPAYIANGKSELYSTHYEKMKSIANEKWFISSSISEKNYYSQKFHSESYILKDIRDFEVPKYMNPKSWSLTTEESSQIIIEQEVA